MEQRIEQRTGIAAAISILAAVGSYILTCMGHPVWGLILALISVPAGIIGLVMAASPRVSGGILSIVAIILGAIGVLVAVLGIVGVIVF